MSNESKEDLATTGSEDNNKRKPTQPKNPPNRPPLEIEESNEAEALNTQHWGELKGWKRLTTRNILAVEVVTALIILLVVAAFTGNAVAGGGIALGLRYPIRRVFDYYFPQAAQLSKRGRQAGKT